VRAAHHACFACSPLASPAERIFCVAAAVFEESHAMITDVEKDAIRRSWRLVVPIAETAADLFYKRLFELRPEYRALFPEDMKAQKRKLLQMLAFVVRSLEWADEAWRDTVPVDEDLFLVVLALGRRHSELYKIPDDSYGPVGEALIWTLDYGLGEAFSDDVRKAWLAVYQLLAKTMRMSGFAVDRDATLGSRAHALELGEATLAGDQAQLGLSEHGRESAEGEPRPHDHN
jgi:hemoglobin-like flavoprotein